MRSLFLLLLVAYTLAVPFTASAQTGQTPSSSSVPAKAKKGAKVSDSKPPDPAASKTEMPKHDYSQEAFVVEQYRSSYRFESDGTGRRETVARIKVQSEAGVQQWGQIQIGYNSANERVEIAYVRVVKADGSIVKAGDDAVQDLTAPVEREAPLRRRRSHPPSAPDRARAVPGRRADRGGTARDRGRCSIGFLFRGTRPPRRSRATRACHPSTRCRSASLYPPPIVVDPAP